MAHGPYWTPAENAVIRACFADGGDAARVMQLLPRRQNRDSIMRQARKLGCAVRAPQRRPAKVALVPHEPHPKGYIRPIMCPHCDGVFTVPADPAVPA